MENTESNFQWSLKLDTGEIYVCRADTFPSLKVRIKEIKDEIETQQTRKEIDSVPINKELDEPEQEGKECREHSVAMTKAYSEKKQKWYWYHDIGKNRCFGYGLLS